jgi:hypothetical protein
MMTEIEIEIEIEIERRTPLFMYTLQPVTRHGLMEASVRHARLSMVNRAYNHHGWGAYLSRLWKRS